MSSLFRTLRCFLIRFTPLIMPHRDMAYAQFTAKSISMDTPQKYLKVLLLAGILAIKPTSLRI